MLSKKIVSLGMSVLLMSSISAPAFAANVVSPSVSSSPIMFFVYTNKASSTLNISNGKATIRGYKPNLWAKDIANILVEGKTSLSTLKQKTLSEGIINASLCLEIADTYCKD